MMGNARSLATLMTMLGAETLIDREAHVGMLEMLRKEVETFKQNSTLSDGTTLGRGEWSPIGNGMYDAYATDHWKAAQAPWDYMTTPAAPSPHDPLAASKIGFSGPNVCDALLIRNDRPLAAGGTIPITAVLVAIDNQTADVGLIHDFGVAMAKVLDNRHGVTAT
jgi:hypothetical protein